MIILVASRQVTDSTTVPKLGANECRIETTSRSCWEGNGSAFKTTILKVIQVCARQFCVCDLFGMVSENVTRTHSKVEIVSNPTIGDKVWSRIESPRIRVLNLETHLIRWKCFPLVSLHDRIHHFAHGPGYRVEAFGIRNGWRVHWDSLPIIVLYKLKWIYETTRECFCEPRV